MKTRIIQICDKAIEYGIYTLPVVMVFSISLVEIAATTMIAAWFLKRAIDRDFSFSRYLPVRLLFAYWVWTILSCVNTGYPNESFRGILKVGEYAMMFGIAATCLWRKDMVRKFIYAIGAGLVLASLNGFYQYYTGAGFIRPDRTLIYKDYLSRVSSSFVHPNDFGVYLVVAAVVFIALFISTGNRSRERLLFFSLFVLAAVSLYLTKSRGAWVSFAFGAVVFGALKGKKILIAFLVLLLAGFLAIPSAMRGRITDLADLKSGTSWERVMLWKGAVRMINVHPVLGFGTNTYSRNFPDYKPEEYPDMRYAHNSYLQIATEVGLVGMTLFILFLVSVFAVSIRNLAAMPEGREKSLVMGMVGGLAAFSINSAFDTHLFSIVLVVFFHLLLGLCFILSERGQKAVGHP